MTSTANTVLAAILIVIPTLTAVPTPILDDWARNHDDKILSPVPIGQPFNVPWRRITSLRDTHWEFTVLDAVATAEPSCGPSARPGYTYIESDLRIKDLGQSYISTSGKEIGVRDAVYDDPLRLRPVRYNPDRTYLANCGPEDHSVDQLAPLQAHSTDPSTNYSPW